MNADSKAVQAVSIREVLVFYRVRQTHDVEEAARMVLKSSGAVRKVARCPIPGLLELPVGYGVHTVKEQSCGWAGGVME